MYTTEQAVAPGQTLTGLNIRADYLGSEQPGSQRFIIFDPETFAELETDFTQAISLPPPPSSNTNPVIPVPVNHFYSLLITALILIGLGQKKLLASHCTFENGNSYPLAKYLDIRFPTEHQKGDDNHA